jgi:soluble lytic murein transglycosylase
MHAKLNDPKAKFEDTYANEIAARFLLAKRDPKQACEIYRDLSELEEFPLRDLTKVRILQTCDLALDDIQDIWEDWKSETSWLDEEYTRTSLTLANLAKDHNSSANFSYQLEKFLKVKKERVELLQNSMRKLEDSDPVLKEKIRQRLVEIAPRFSKVITDENIYKVARDFERNREFKKARKLYKQIIHNPQSDFKSFINALNRTRLSYKIERRLETYVKKTHEMTDLLEELWKDNPEDKELKEAWLKSMITLTRAVWTRHDRPSARNILRRAIAHKIQDQKQLAVIYWLFGSMSLEEKKLNRAVNNFKKALTYKHNDKDLKNRLLWALARNHYHMKKYKKASKMFLAFVNKTKSETYQNRFKFWAAKSFMKINHKTKAKKLLRELTKSDEFGYYGLLAHKELRLPLGPLKNSKAIPAIYDNTFEWLLTVGEKDLAKRYLDSLRKTLKNSKKRWSALNLYKRADYHDGLIKTYFNLSEKDRKNLLSINPSYAYPNPHQPIIEAAQKKYGVNKNLIYAISRQESAFNPQARSWADAFGLMQLIPERAYVLGPRHKIPYRTPTDLYNPNVNIPMGAALLSSLKKQFKQEFPFYVASYNASDKAVTHWHKQRFQGDYVEFIEEIPYAETRKYVKLVLRNMLIYRRLHSDKEFYFTNRFFRQ